MALTRSGSRGMSVSRLPPAAEADEDLADVNFGDAPSAGSAADAGQDESQWLCTSPADTRHTPTQGRSELMLYPAA